MLNSFVKSKQFLA
jgi:hypothetical protein